MDEVIDDLISLESDFNDGGLDCMEPNIIMQNNVSMNQINFCSNSYLLTPFLKNASLRFFCIDFLRRCLCGLNHFDTGLSQPP